MIALPPNIKKAGIHIGGVFSSREPAVIRTVLGSCVAACLYDPVALAGGMNHFMLPGGEDADLPTRFGVHAMEVLINQLMELGADRRRLKAKIFGGADVLKMRGNFIRVAEKNREFIKQFLSVEGIPIVAQRLGGTDPLQVYFFTHDAKVLIKPLRRDQVERVIDQESSYSATIKQKETTKQVGEITLF